MLDVLLGFGVKSVDETDKNPYPLGACILLEKKMNTIHMQNGTIWGGNLVSEKEKTKAGTAKGDQGRPGHAFIAHLTDLHALLLTGWKHLPLVLPL